LDAIGVGQDSGRRGYHGGAEEHRVLQDDVEVWLIDERWSRDPLPCGLREPWCEVSEDEERTYERRLERSDSFCDERSESRKGLG